MNEISPQQAYRKVLDGSAVLLDVREDAEVAGARISGALHIPLGQLNDRAAELPEHTEVLPICQSGTRSAFVTDVLDRNGYRAANVSGGVEAWRKAGLPVES